MPMWISAVWCKHCKSYQTGYIQGVWLCCLTCKKKIRKEIKKKKG